MSVEWKTVTLGDVAEFVRGITFKPEDVVPKGTPGSVACMRTKNVQADLDLSDVWSVGERFVGRENQFLQMGDILVSSANSWNLVGKCCWIPRLPVRATFGGFVSVLRPRPAKVEPRFLFRWFSSNRIQTTLRSFGQQTTNISNLNLDRCLKLPLLLPPLAEQRRVVEVLNRAEALRTMRRATLAKLDNLAQASFLDLFGEPARNSKDLPTVSLGEIGKWQSGGTPPRAREDYFEGPVPWFSSGELEEMIVYKSKEHISGQALRETSARAVPRGALMLGMYDTAALKASIAGVDCSCNQAIAFAVFNKKVVETVFVYFAIVIGREHFRRLQRGVRQKNLNLKMVREIRVPLPPVSLQRKFAGLVAAIETLKVTHYASLVKLNRIFVSLQYRAFRGEL